MCTATLLVQAGGILITFNRDERRSRASEVPPMIWQLADGVRMIAPRDSAQSGTWCAVNEHGLGAIIMNGYDQADTKNESPRPSRGLILPQILNHRRIDDAVTFLINGLNAKEFASFNLVLFDRESVWIASWKQGGTLEPKALVGDLFFWTSSSWNTSAVIAYRQAKFEQWVSAGEPFQDSIPCIHLQTEPTMEESSILMTRAESCTRSITQIELSTSGDIRMRYWERDRLADGPAVVEFPA